MRLELWIFDEEVNDTLTILKSIKRTEELKYNSIDYIIRKIENEQINKKD